MSTGWNDKADALMDARVQGYELAARQAREGKRIARPLHTGERVVFMVVVFVAFAAVALTANWVL